MRLLAEVARNSSVPVAQQGVLTMGIANTCMTSRLEAGNKSSEEFFCGYLPESEIERRLTKEGDFLVRKVIKGDEDTYVLSYIEPRLLHDTHCFDCISSLVAYHCNKNLSVDEFDGKIKTGVKRDSWQLYHAQIENLKKLGNGALAKSGYASYKLGCSKKSKLLSKYALHLKKHKLRKAKNYLRKRRQFAMYEQPIKIALELCPGGSVLDLLENHHKRVDRGASPTFNFGCRQRNGLLRTRNDNSPRYCSPKYSHWRVKKLQKVPVRYLAPETLKEGHFSSKSDVFAFGVYIWEVYQNGRQPWEDIEDHRKIMKLVRGGSRLQNDNDLCPQVLWELAENCWKQEPLQRPSFSEIVAEYGRWMRSTKAMDCGRE
uniref:Protein kinase domain-containing protein n=1 Tax=Ditylenchus dipsaci TaxID=166011 RepID=A0A915DP03_9BILA